jgi:hypothetical protein
MDPIDRKTFLQHGLLSVITAAVVGRKKPTPSVDTFVLDRSKLG